MITFNTKQLRDSLELKTVDNRHIYLLWRNHCNSSWRDATMRFSKAALQILRFICAPEGSRGASPLEQQRPAAIVNSLPEATAHANEPAALRPLCRRSLWQPWCSCAVQRGECDHVLVMADSESSGNKSLKRRSQLSY